MRYYLIKADTSFCLSKQEFIEELLLAEQRMNTQSKLRFHIEEIDEQGSLLMVSDNCNAFRDWLDTNEIPYLRGGSFTIFDTKKVNLPDVMKKYGVYEYLNKPKDDR